MDLIGNVTAVMALLSAFLISWNIAEFLVTYRKPTYPNYVPPRILGAVLIITGLLLILNALLVLH